MRDGLVNYAEVLGSEDVIDCGDFSQEGADTSQLIETFQLIGIGLILVLMVGVLMTGRTSCSKYTNAST